MRVSRYVLTTLVIALAVVLQACSPEVAPENACNFVQNSLFQRVSWGGKVPVKMYIHDSVTDPNFVAAIEAAATRWNEIVGKQVISIEASFVSGELNAKKDGRSFIYMYNTWETNRPTEQARTTIYWTGDRINEADIKINAKNFRYTTEPAANTSRVDLESLMIHELGHVLGLAHLDHRESVMATTLASGSVRREIGNPDINNLSCEYPVASTAKTVSQSKIAALTKDNLEHHEH